MQQCEFCSIIRGDAPAEVLYRNDQALAILDIRPIHYGHILVIPVHHAEHFLEIPEEAAGDLFLAMRTVTEALLGAFNPPGYNIFSNNGRAAGQSVFHFHFHITPRYDDDNIRFVLTLKQYSNNQMAEYGERIREVIRTLPPTKNTGR